MTVNQLSAVAKNFGGLILIAPRENCVDFRSEKKVSTSLAILNDYFCMKKKFKI